MAEETSRIVLPSATGFAARQAIAVLRKHKVPIAPLLKRVGVSEDDIDNRQHRISALAQGQLLEYAGEALGDHLFGLHLAQHANPAKRDCSFMSLPLPKTSARRWRSSRAIAASPTKPCA